MRQTLQSSLVVVTETWKQPMCLSTGGGKLRRGTAIGRKMTEQLKQTEGPTRLDLKPKEEHGTGKGGVGGQHLYESGNHKLSCLLKMDTYRGSEQKYIC